MNSEQIKAPVQVNSKHFCTKCGKPASFCFQAAYYCYEDAQYEYKTELSIAKARENASGLPAVSDAVVKPGAGLSKVP